MEYLKVEFENVGLELKIKEILSPYWKNQIDIFPVEKTFYLESYIPQLIRMTHSKLNKLS